MGREDQVQNTEDRGGVIKEKEERRGERRKRVVCGGYDGTREVGEGQGEFTG